MRSSACANIVIFLNDDQIWSRLAHDCFPKAVVDNSRVSQLIRHCQLFRQADDSISVAQDIQEARVSKPYLLYAYTFCGSYL